MTFFGRRVVGILLDQPGFAEIAGCLDFGCDDDGSTLCGHSGRAARRSQRPAAGLKAGCSAHRAG
jgi:hypothetical protein